MSVSKCTQCNESDGKLRRCAGCFAVSYCSKECQSVHWKSVHKKECKLKQIDKILNALSDDEKTGFMEVSELDCEIVRNCEKSAFGIPPKRLPDVLTFINPIRYLTSMIDMTKESIKEMKRQAATESFDSTPFKDLDLPITHMSTCSQTFGTIKYLAMCSNLNNYMTFFTDHVEGNAAVKNAFDDFVNELRCKFKVLLVFLGLSQYELTGDRVHYFTVIRMNNKYRLIQSFGRKFSLKQMLNAKDWMNEEEIMKILDGFLQLEKIGLDRKMTEEDLVMIKEKSKLCLGFELKVDPDAPKRREDQMMKASVLKDLSFRHFKAASQHLLDYMDYLLDKIEKRELGSMSNDADLRFRVGYPVCLNQEALRSFARRWPSRYSNYL